MLQSRMLVTAAMLHNMRETRMSRRYLLREVITFTCIRRDNSVSQTGVTENVSSSGVLFLTSARVEVGSYIGLDLFLRMVSRQTHSIKLHAEGVVVRVEPVDSLFRVAANIRFEDEQSEDLLGSFWF